MEGLDYFSKNGYKEMSLDVRPRKRPKKKIKNGLEIIFEVYNYIYYI